MRYVLFLAMMLAPVVAAWAQVGDYSTLYVRGEDADAPVALSSVSYIEFPVDGGVRFALDDGSVAVFTDEEFVSLRFDVAHPEIPSDEPDPVVPGDDEKKEEDGVGDAFVAEGLAFDGRTVVSSYGLMALYDSGGGLITVTRCGSIDVSGLSSGVYVAVSGGVTFKFVRR